MNADGMLSMLKCGLDRDRMYALKTGRTTRMLEEVLIKSVSLPKNTEETILVVFNTSRFIEGYAFPLLKSLADERCLDIEVDIQNYKMVVGGTIEILLVSIEQSQGICRHCPLTRFIDHDVEEKILMRALGRAESDLKAVRKGE